MISEKPRLHICIFNIYHANYVIDQLEYMMASFKQNGYEVSVSNHFREDRLNIMIEDMMNDHVCPKIIDFCKRTNKKISIVMTEHVDFTNGKLYAYSRPINKKNNYSPYIEKRVNAVVSLLPYTEHLFTLGYYPKLQNFHEFCGKRPIVIPYPQIAKKTEIEKPNFDFVFSGAYTEYREMIINKVKERSFTIKDNSYKKILNRHQRNKLISDAKINLNIAQDKHWTYPSLLRIILGLSLGKMTVFLYKDKNLYTEDFYKLVDLKSLDVLNSYLENYEEHYSECLENYNKAAGSMEFCHNTIKFWGKSEKLV